MATDGQLTRQQSAGTADDVLAEAYIYKGTSSNDVVVKRFLRLFRDKFLTYHNFDKDPLNCRTWTLDKSCQLVPKRADQLESKTKVVRPPGVWTAVAAVTGTGRDIHLYSFKILWPKPNPAGLMSRFLVGFEDKQEAILWHEKFQTLLGRCTSDVQVPMSLIDRDMRASDAEVREALSSPEAQTADNGKMARGGNQASGGSPFQSADEHVSSSSSFQRISSSELSKWEISSLDNEELTSTGPQPKRWIPYKHSNGLAIYFHQGRSEEDGTGGEYMVSAVVHGTPSDCLSVLLNPNSTTTILGPASHLEVLDSQGVANQTLYVQLEAGGPLGDICSPREAIVRRLLKKEDHGVYVILFSSVDAPLPDELKTSIAKRPWYRRPVRADVKGGFTISRLEDYEGESSPESLVTCILKVDLGGACRDGGMTFRLAKALGLVDAFVERMLMAVILVKDEVEHRKFAVRPFSLSPEESVEDEGLAGLRTSTLILRNPAASGMKLSKMATRRIHLDKPGTPRSPVVDTSDTQDPSGSAIRPQDMDELCSADDDVIPNLEGTLNRKYYHELHVDSQPAPFRVRGATYLKDKIKIPAGEPHFELQSVDLVSVSKPLEHISRFLPTVRRNGAGFSFVVSLSVPGTPIMYLVFTFVTDSHPSMLGSPPDPSSEHDWSPFDFLLHKFVNGSDDVRNGMFKLIPHIAEGSWVIKQSVGTTPVILGRKVRTVYYQTPKYIEVGVDVTASSAANYITSMVRGCTTSLVIDIGFVLEGTEAHELPEVLLGAVRFPRLDLSTATPLDTSKEVPLRKSALLGEPVV